ncbi:MAG: hypothetical protein M3O98_03070 [Actinomycetota bacterium]|nr:hypothetical protein [Actinomycetota bacterium]
MPRENAAAKARRLLVEGRLAVLYVGDGEITVAVKGDSGEVHRVAYTRGRWTCDCPAIGACSHGIAAALVTVVPSARRWCDVVRSA